MLRVMQHLTFSPLSSTAYEIKTSKSGNEPYQLFFISSSSFNGNTFSNGMSQDNIFVTHNLTYYLLLLFGYYVSTCTHFSMISNEEVCLFNITESQKKKENYLHFILKAILPLTEAKMRFKFT